VSPPPHFGKLPEFSLNTNHQSTGCPLDSIGSGATHTGDAAVPPPHAGGGALVPGGTLCDSVVGVGPGPGPATGGRWFVTAPCTSASASGIIGPIVLTALPELLLWPALSLLTIRLGLFFGAIGFITSSCVAQLQSVQTVSLTLRLEVPEERFE
jgi:hypothetical protein